MFQDKTETKSCKYCGKEFTRADFPRSFDRMITCASPECMGKRRHERLGH
jgi:hypothetical protein